MKIRHGCPINFGDCPYCEYFSEGQCNYELEQEAIKKLKKVRR